MNELAIVWELMKSMLVLNAQMVDIQAEKRARADTLRWNGVADSHGVMMILTDPPSYCFQGYLRTKMEDSVAVHFDTDSYAGTGRAIEMWLRNVK